MWVVDDKPGNRRRAGSTSSVHNSDSVPLGRLRPPRGRFCSSPEMALGPSVAGFFHPVQRQSEVRLCPEEWRDVVGDPLPVFQEIGLRAPVGIEA